jgi:hypothetical protein
MNFSNMLYTIVLKRSKTTSVNICIALASPKLRSKDDFSKWAQNHGYDAWRFARSAKNILYRQNPSNFKKKWIQNINVIIVLIFFFKSALMKINWNDFIWENAWCSADAFCQVFW